MLIKFTLDGRDVEFDLDDLTLGDWEDLGNAGIDLTSGDIDMTNVSHVIPIMRVVLRATTPQFAGADFDNPELVAQARAVKLMDLLGEGDEGDPTGGAASQAPGGEQKPKPRAKGKKAPTG